MSHEAPTYAEVDPFDLPEWLGESEVTWESERPFTADHRVTGQLTSDGHESMPCDLLAVDDAYPVPVAADETRMRAHQVWSHGEVLLASEGDRLLLVVPGSRLDTETVLTAVGRLARAVGARDGDYAVRLRVGNGR
ncbi:MAG TPA: hypothetical protein VFM08_12365 [Nocardioides sp.]|jgi:hypothetical protein|nr:hypothetical protein [Nocardioides sp.]